MTIPHTLSRRVESRTGGDWPPVPRGPPTRIMGEFAGMRIVADPRLEPGTAEIRSAGRCVTIKNIGDDRRNRLLDQAVRNVAESYAGYAGPEAVRGILSLWAYPKVLAAVTVGGIRAEFARLVVEGAD